MHVIIHLLTARLPQTKEANYGYIFTLPHSKATAHILSTALFYLPGKEGY